MAESLAAVGVAELIVLAVMPMLAPTLQGAGAMAAHAVAVLLLAAPALYWRGMQAVRRTLASAASPRPADAAQPGIRNPGLRSQEQRRQRAIAMTAGAQLVGLALTAAVCYSMKLQIDEDLRQRFDRHAERLETEISRRFNLPVKGLQGARSAYLASMAVSRAQFQRYVASRNALTEFPGARGFGLLQRVAREDLPAFVAAQQADGAPGFALQGSSDAALRYVVKQIEPLEPNRSSLGVDFGADPAIRRAIEQAVDSGEPTLAPYAGLTQGAQAVPGFLVLVPIYQDMPATPQQRRDGLRGLMFAPLSAPELLNGVARTAADGALDFELFDGDGSQTSQLLFDADGHLGTGQGAGKGSVGPQNYAGRWQDTARTLAIGGRLLTLRISTSPAFETAVDRRPLLYTALGGVLLSTLLALVVWALAAGRIRAQTLAERMTADLERLAQVVRHTSNAVTITDPQLRITWVNEGFTRISGYDAASAIGKTPGELLASGQTQPETLLQLAEAAAQGAVCRMEVFNRARDGRGYWMDTEIQPLRDAQGRLTGFMEIGSDITDKRRAAEQLAAATQGLKEKEHLMRLVTDNMPARIAYWDAGLHLRFGNQAFFQRFGSAERCLGQPARLVLGERFQSGALLAAAANGTAQRVEREETGADGESTHWLTLMIPDLRDAQVHGFVALTLDITASKRTEAELRRSVATMRAIVDNLPCALSVVDREMNVVVHNSQYRQLLRLPDGLFDGTVTRFEDIVRHNALRGDYGPGDVEALVAMTMQRVSRPAHRNFEREYDGSITLDARAAPMPDGGFVTTYTDITARRRTEERLRESEHLMRLATDNMPGTIAYWDSERRLRFANRAFLKHFSPQGGGPSVIGQHARQILGEALFQRTNSDVDRVLGGESWSFERVDSPGGEPRHMITHMVPDERDSRVHGFVALTLDITTIKLAESKLRHANQALTVARDRAEQASQAKGQFLANMSHEIRTPMNAVLGMLKLLQHTLLTPKQHDYVGKAEGAARALLGLLNDILDFSKVEAGKLALDPRPFRLRKLLDELGVILSANLGRKPVELRFEIEPDVPAVVVGDDLRLMQVLVNLGGNAIKFTELGEVVIGVRRVAVHDGAVLLAFSVRDTGIGITPEQQRHIFSAFSQAEASTTRRFGGTGLGLAICQRLVALMGSGISLQSTPDVGSCFGFELSLPLAQEHEAPALPVPAAPGEALQIAGPGAMADNADNAETARPRLAGLRLLVVEDNANNQQVAQELLEAEGALVQLAADGEQGVAAVAGAQPPFDAVLMDVQMPVMDGYTATQHIRRLAGQQRLPIIAMTANAMSSDRDASRAAGMDDHIGKPFDLDELVQSLLRHVAVAGGADSSSKPGSAPASARPSALASTSASAAASASASASALTATPMAAPALAASPVNSSAPSPVAATTGSQRPAPGGLPATLLSVSLQQGLDLAAALRRLGGRSEVWLRSAQTLVRDLPGIAQQFRQGLAQGQRAEASRLMHTLKGTSGTLGLVALAREAAALETALRPAGPARTTATIAEPSGSMPLESIAEAASLIGQLEQAIEPALALLAGTIGQLQALRPAVTAGAPAQAPAQRDSAALREQLLPLAALLQASDMAATDALSTLQAGSGSAWPAELAPLADAMTSLDFERAARLCAELAAALDASAPEASMQTTTGQDTAAQDPYAQDPCAPDAYAQDTYAHDTFAQDSAAQNPSAPAQPARALASEDQS